MSRSTPTRSSGDKQSVVAEPKEQARQRSVLVVDDSPIHLRLVARQLQSYLGCHVIEANGTEDALLKLLGSTPDLIITDLMMPDLDGVDLVTITETRSAWSPIPIVVLSAVRDSERVSALNGTRVREYLLKPFDPSVVVPRLRRILAETADLQPEGARAPLDAPEDRIPVLVVTAKDSIIDIVRRELPAPYHVLAADAGPGALPAALECQPFAVLLAKEVTAWDVPRTISGLRALRTLERVRVRPLPTDESEIAELVRREFHPAPFSIDVTAEGINVLVEERFTVGCVKSLARGLDRALAEHAAEVTFELPAEGLGPKALAAIQHLAQALTPRS